MQDVQRQLDLNGAAVRVDEASQQYLDEWQNEQLNAYSMFEALVDEGVRGRAGQENSVLMKNKNRVSEISYNCSLANAIDYYKNLADISIVFKCVSCSTYY